MHAWRQGRAIPDARRHTTQIHPKFALNSVLTSSPLASPPPPLSRQRAHRGAPGPGGAGRAPPLRGGHRGPAALASSKRPQPAALKAGVPKCGWVCALPCSVDGFGGDIAGLPPSLQAGGPRAPCPSSLGGAALVPLHHAYLVASCFYQNLRVGSYHSLTF